LILVSEQAFYMSVVGPLLFFVYTNNKSRPTTEPCGIPQCTYDMGELTFPITV